MTPTLEELQAAKSTLGDVEEYLNTHLLDNDIAREEYPNDFRIIRAVIEAATITAKEKEFENSLAGTSIRDLTAKLREDGHGVVLDDAFRDIYRHLVSRLLERVEELEAAIAAQAAGNSASSKMETTTERSSEVNHVPDVGKIVDDNGLKPCPFCGGEAESARLRSTTTCALCSTFTLYR